MSIVDWVYAYPGTLEALLVRQWAPDDIFAMSTAQALDYASRAIRPVGSADILTIAMITRESAQLLASQLSMSARPAAEAAEGA
jgi:hypothetical protein